MSISLDPDISCLLFLDHSCTKSDNLWIWTLNPLGSSPSLTSPSLRDYWDHGHKATSQLFSSVYGWGVRPPGHLPTVPSSPVVLLDFIQLPTPPSLPIPSPCAFRNCPPKTLNEVPKVTQIPNDRIGIWIKQSDSGTPGHFNHTCYGLHVQQILQFLHIFPEEPLHLLFSL